MEVIVSVFTDAQQSAAYHKNCIRKLTGLLTKASAAECQEYMNIILRGCIDPCLLMTKKEVGMDRVCKFYCDFLNTASTFSEPTIFRLGVEHFLVRSQATDKNVRSKACQYLSRVILSLGTDIEIANDLWENISSTLTPRLRDKDAKVRMWAVKALGRLQNADEEDQLEEGGLISEMLRVMSTDSASAVRVAACDTVLLTKSTLVSIVDRVSDVKPEVRTASLERLSKDVSLKHLSSTQRATIVQFGLGDRDETVKKTAIALIYKWVVSVHYKIPKLLQLLNIVVNEDVATLVGRTLIELVENPGDYASIVKSDSQLRDAVRIHCPNWHLADEEREERASNASNLQEEEEEVPKRASLSSFTAPEILWVLIRCEYAKSKFSSAIADETMESLMPDMVLLCKLLEEAHSSTLLYEKESLQISVKSLLRLTAFLDRSDIAGSMELVRVAEAMLLDMQFPEHLIDSVLDAWLRGLGKADSCTILANIIALSERFGSILEDPTLTESLGLDEHSLEILAATRGLQLVLWALKKSIGDKKSIRSLTDNFNTFIFASLQSTSVDMRALSVQCLGIMGLCNEESCEQHRDILFQVAYQELESLFVREYALQGLVDLALIHPVLFQDNVTLIELLISLMEMDDKYSTFRLIATESALKLLFSGVLNSSKLFANVTKYFFFPTLLSGVRVNKNSNDGAEVEEEEVDEVEKEHFQVTLVRLQQVMSLFFQAYFLVQPTTTLSNSSHSNTESTIAEVVESETVTVPDYRKRALTVWSSVSDIIADTITLVRDDCDVHSLQHIYSHLFHMWDNHQDNNIPAAVCLQAKKELHIRFTSVLAREMLSLGDGKKEKTVLKECMKIFLSMPLEEYCQAQTKLCSAMSQIVFCLSTNCSQNLDRASKVGLSAFEKAVQELQAVETTSGRKRNISGSTLAAIDDGDEDGVMLETGLPVVSSRREFFNFAPGLAALIAMTFDGDDSEEEEEEEVQGDAAIEGEQGEEIMGVEDLEEVPSSGKRHKTDIVESEISSSSASRKRASDVEDRTGLSDVTATSPSKALRTENTESSQMFVDENTVN